MATKLYDINNCKPPTVRWLKDLIEPVHIGKNSNEKGLFSFNEPYNANLWNMFQYSFPPLFSTKYHIINVDNLNETYDDCKQLSAISSVVMWDESLSLSLLNLIYKNHSIKGTTKKGNKYTDDFIKNCKNTLKLVNLTLYDDDKMPLENSDFCNSVSELLLQPYVQMQLPWKTMLFHQWLVLALSEILIFERECVELKHWCINNEIIPATKLLLNLIRTLKDNIMLGFAILNEQVVTYPKCDTKHCDYIFDNVVLPSIPVLEFLINRDALVILKKIKCVAFNVKTCKDSYIPYESIYLDAPLAKLHANFAYNFCVWSQGSIPNIFPKSTEELKSISQRMKENKPQVPVYNKPIFDIPIKVMSQEEKCLLELLEKNLKSSRIGNEERVQLTIQIIKDKVLGKLENVSESDVEMKFSSQKCKKQAGEIFDNKMTDNIHHAIRQALLSNEAYRLLIDCQLQDSVASQIISLQLHILELEQIARLTHTCALIFNTKIKCVKSEIDIKEITLKLEEIEEKVKTQNRDKFWSQFSIELQQPVDVNNYPEIPIEVKDIHDYLIYFINKLNQINLNITKECYKLKGNDVFKHWNMIQRILPYCIYTLSYECGENIENAILIEMMVALFKHYESSYIDWIANPESHRKCTEYPNMVKKLLKSEIRYIFSFQSFLYSSCITIRVHRDVFRLLSKYLTLYPNVTFREKFEFLLKYIRSWHFNVLHHNSEIFTEMCSILHNWCSFNYNLLNVCYTVFNKSFDILEPGTKLVGHEKLSELYYTLTVIDDLILIYVIETVEIEEENEFMDDAEADLQNAQNDLQACVFLAQQGYKQDNSEFIENTTEIVYGMYKKLKAFKKRHGTIRKKLLINLPHQTMYPKVNKAIQCFMDGDMAGLDRLLTIFKHFTPDLVEEEDVVVKKKKDNCCRQCGKSESVRKLLTCEKCITDQYPDVNYFCGRRCQETRWKNEHMAEHLEFELDLGKFSTLEVGK